MPKLKTELGLKIEVTKSHKLAEGVAAFRLELDDLKERYKKRLDDLQKQMNADGVATLTARAGGVTFQFSVVDKGETVQVKTIIEKQTEKAKDD